MQHCFVEALYAGFFFNPLFKYWADFPVFESGIKNYIIMGNGLESEISPHAQKYKPK